MASTADPSIPSSKEVSTLHTNADTDGSQQSAHHTLGSTPNQGSPGDHNHDGGNSQALLDGVILTGVKTGSAALISIAAALASLGATDNMT